MILVLLGTQDKEFIRLVKEVDRLVCHEIISDEVVIQQGNTKCEVVSSKIKVFDFIDIDSLNKLIEKADIVISHGGVGSIVSCIRNKKKLIVFPRLKKYGEHVDDHQLQIVKLFYDRGYLLYSMEVSQLECLIRVVKEADYKRFAMGNKKMIKLIKDYIK